MLQSQAWKTSDYRNFAHSRNIRNGKRCATSVNNLKSIIIMAQQFNPKNKDIQVYINGKLYHRNEAKVSVFDSVVQGGDSVWEGIRVYDGRVFALDLHLNRLQESAKSMAFEKVPSNEFIKEAIFETLRANGMRDKAHIRLTLTRGEKITSGMNPELNQSGCTLIVLAEWKSPIYPEKTTLVTAQIRRNSPLCIDSKIHHNNVINNILAKIEANLIGAHDAVMLDLYGYVAETNATNIFMTKKDVLYTPRADSCLPGITRGLVLDLAKKHGIPAVEKNISITELYNADEVFTTGTMGEISRVGEIDGRVIENKFGSTVMGELKRYFKALTQTEGTPLPF